MFSVGNIVCYPMHGVGVIEAIELKKVLGKENLYYILRFFANNMTAMVPIGNADIIGLREIVSREVCERVIANFDQDIPEESLNRNQRYRDNLDRLRSGDIFESCDVVKCLSKREKERGLSAGEKKMFMLARQILIAELSLASGKEELEIMEMIGI